MNIENKKQIATVLLAVGLGLVAVFLTSQYVQTTLQQQTKTLVKEYQQQGAAVKKELEITKKELEKLYQRQEALAKQLKEQPKVIIKEEAQVPGKPPIDKTVFSVVTPPGKRALTVQIDALSAVGGLTSPGDFVDVIAHLKIPEETAEKGKGKVQEVTTVLFQDIQVLAVGTNFMPVGGAELYENQQKARALNVTLAVTPEEAGLLAFVLSNGKIQLSLRSPAGEEGRQHLQVASWGALSDYVLDQQGTELHVPKPKKKESVDEEDPKKEEPKEEEMKPKIRIFRGGREL
jgi:Flp pilus assembly protein CpaB